MIDLLHRIFQCPNFREYSINSSKKPPCAKIVSSQKSLGMTDFFPPEPWSGHLDKAEILFLSSNPSISKTELYPVRSWSRNAVKDFFINRFDTTRKWTLIKPTGGQYYLLQDDKYGSRWVYYWAIVRNLAAEILECDIRKVTPGESYAISEVVHCKSKRQFGVKEARIECARKYLKHILDCSQAKTIVSIGKVTDETVREGLKQIGLHCQETEKVCTLKLGRKQRHIAFLPHPRQDHDKEIRKKIIKELHRRLLGN